MVRDDTLLYIVLIKISLFLYLLLFVSYFDALFAR